jgi:hypothetical protein
MVAMAVTAVTRGNEKEVWYADCYPSSLKIDVQRWTHVLVTQANHVIYLVGTVEFENDSINVMSRRYLNHKTFSSGPRAGATF